MKKSLFTALAAVLGLTANVMAQVPSYVPTNGLVGWWPFNGNANDESGNGNNGTVNGATLTADRNGNANNAFSFDGNDWIEVLYNSGFNFGIQSFTLSCWSVKTGANQWQHLITRNYIPTFPTSVNNYALRYELNTIVLFSGGNATNSNGIIQSSNLLDLNSWNHIVGVYNSSIQKMQIYLNGDMIVEASINLSPQNYNSIGNMYFGVEHPAFPLPSGPQFLTGKIDDIGIWNRALSECEIADLYNSQLGSFSNSSVSINPSLSSLGSNATLTVTTPIQNIQWQSNPGNMGWNNVVNNNTYNGSNNDT